MFREEARARKVPKNFATFPKDSCQWVFLWNLNNSNHYLLSLVNPQSLPSTVPID
jgi:hypothetical protein